LASGKSDPFPSGSSESPQGDPTASIGATASAA
jgi:hypothetical protein